MTDDFQQEKQLISCKVCGATERLLRCSKCKLVFYCSQTHQQTDWRSHKVDCRSYNTNNNSAASNGESSSKSSLLTNTSSARISQPQFQQQEQNLLFNQQQPQQQQQNVWSENTTSSSKNTVQDTVASLPKQGSSETEILSVNAEVLSSRPQYDHIKKYDIDDDQDNSLLYRSLADNSMPISSDNILSPNLTPSDMGHEELCKHIINDLNMYGLCVIDDFLGKHKGLEILNEVHNMYNAGVFKNGQLVSNAVAEQDLRTIRGDLITWVRGTESGCLNIGYLINQVDNVVISANKMHNNGTLGNYKIRERTKAMVACYPGSGAHYVMHVDNPNKDGRVITAIYYLNLNWDTKRSGGVLRIFPEHTNTVADIEPKFDRIIFFWSDRRNPHEVQPAHRTRYAITVWYFDADERESALNRYRRSNRNNT